MFKIDRGLPRVEKAENSFGEVIYIKLSNYLDPVFSVYIKVNQGVVTGKSVNS